MLQNSQKFRVLRRGRTELTEVPGGYKKCCTRTPGIVERGVQNSQKFRVRVCMSHRTHRSSRYRYESLAELPEVQGIVALAYRTYRSSGQVKKCCTRTRGIVARSYRSYRICGYGYECRTELTEVLCAGMDVVQNSQKSRVRVIPGYIHALGEGVRFEVEDFIQLAWHVLLGQRPRGNP